jgi:hypothetical protein
VKPQFGRADERLLTIVTAMHLLLTAAVTLGPGPGLTVADVVVVAFRAAGKLLFVERGHVLGHGLDGDKLETDLTL